jgi:hypothetical protein
MHYSTSSILFRGRCFAWIVLGLLFHSNASINWSDDDLRCEALELEHHHFGCCLLCDPVAHSMHMRHPSPGVRLTVRPPGPRAHVRACSRARLPGLPRPPRMCPCHLPSAHYAPWLPSSLASPPHLRAPAPQIKQRLEIPTPLSSYTPPHDLTSLTAFATK